MKIKKHLAIFSTDLSLKSGFIQNLLKGKVPEELSFFKDKKGVLFSTYTLEKFISEESQHDDYTLSEKEHRSIKTFSSGEQRKALLNHLLSTNPDFLILDNVFDMLDVSSRAALKHRLEELSQETPIIQIVKRQDNLLPFISNILEVKNQEISFWGAIDEYFQASKPTSHFKIKGKLPAPIDITDAFSDPLIQFNNVEVNYGDKCIVKDINWTIKQGDFWQLKGPNGSGKTTLLSMITGDNPKAYGQDVILFGRRRGTGESIWDIKKKIGYVTPSMISQFRGWNTVEKMVISGFVDSIGLYQKPTELQRRVASEWIELIGLSQQTHTRFSTLNEGQQCMIMIARAMVKHPPLLILDEPAHGLNDYNASILSALVNKIAEEGNTTIIFVSHRNEPGLNPKQVFELVPGNNGSTGKVL